MVLTPLGRVTLSTSTLVKSAVKLSKDLKEKEYFKQFHSIYKVCVNWHVLLIFMQLIAQKISNKKSVMDNNQAIVHCVMHDVPVTLLTTQINIK